MRITEECARVPVTAVAFIVEELVLAGEGNLLKLYDVRRQQELHSVKVFERQAIHGIIVTNKTSTEQSGRGLIVLWGGTRVRLVQFSLNFEELRSSSEASTALALGEERCLRDWIMFCGSVAEELTPSSQCILYSAHLLWADDDRVLVAAGTVFGEILVWSYRFELAKAQLHFVFTGHQGSIFGVQISNSFVRPHAEGPSRMLASCSDDRTIRIWDISELPDYEGALSGPDAVDSLHARDTGFGGSSDGTSTNVGRKDEWLALAWGHQSRIWGVRFMYPYVTEGSQYPFVVSFGEDATFQAWLLDPSFHDNKQSSPAGFALKHLQTASVHSKKNIWSLIVYHNVYNDPNSGMVLTGGADGGIITKPIALSNDSFCIKQQASRVCSIEDLAAVNASGTDEGHMYEVCRAAQNLSKKDSLRGYILLSDTSFLTVDNNGGMMQGQLLEGDTGEDDEFLPNRFWVTSSFHNQDLKDGFASAAIPAAKLSFFSGSHGVVYSYNDHLREFWRVAQLNHKVTALFAQMHEDSHLPNETVSLVAGCFNSQHAYHLTLPLSGNKVDEVVIRLVPLNDSKFVVSSACTVRFEDGGILLFLGSRNGELAVYTIDKESRRSRDEIDSTLVYSAVRSHELHGKEAVTSLQYLDSQVWHTDNSNRVHLLSTGRDGTYAICRIDTHHRTSEMELLHRGTLPFGPNIEGAVFDQLASNLTLYGFRGKQFVVYDQTSEEEILAVECGGAHRSWVFAPFIDSGLGTVNGGMFVWTQASDMHAYSTRQRSHHVVRHGLHGREIKAVDVLNVKSENEVHTPSLIATGAEDTTIRLTEYRPDQPGHKGGFACRHVLRRHVTGIQHLQFSHCTATGGNTYLLSSGGFEEFFVWRIRPAPLVRIGVVLESVCASTSELPDLRTMSFTVQRHEVVKRGMELENVMVILMVYSDSTIKQYRYGSTSNEQSWSLLHTGTYVTSCLTQSFTLNRHDISTFWTGGTDGHVALWAPSSARYPSPNSSLANSEEPGTMNWLKRHRIHRSTIKCLDTAILADNSKLIVTGGDDNALAFTRVVHPSGSEVPQLFTLRIPNAHAAAITALAVLEMVDDVTRVATASNDQRLKLWELTWDLNRTGVEGLHVRRVANLFTPVADVSSMALIRNGADLRVLICGVGLDVWKIVF